MADVNNDGRPDIFLTHGAGEHRLLLGDGKGKFREAPGTREVFRWKLASADDNPAGVCIADVNRDGLPDIVIGNHFKSPWTTPAPVRLYLHRGIKDGVPTLEDISEAAGLRPLEMKAPHVEIQDFDNDGWPDIYVSIIKFKDGRPCPVIYKNLGVRDGIPRFYEDAWAVNDFPTAEDKALKRSGPLFDKILKEKKIIYMAAGPSGDFDRDGRSSSAWAGLDAGTSGFACGVEFGPDLPASGLYCEVCLEPTLLRNPGGATGRRRRRSELTPFAEDGVQSRSPFLRSHRHGDGTCPTSLALEGEPSCPPSACRQPARSHPRPG